MKGFITHSGTIYYLDVDNQMICGGNIKTPAHYYKCNNVIIGLNPFFYLDDGKILKTSVIEQFI